MFGLMFGDMGHGSILGFLGLFLTLGADRLQKTGFKSLLPFRYFLLLMGLCSTYSGFMYNEFFAMPTQIFGSCYNLDAKREWFKADDMATHSKLWFYDRPDFKCTYPFGIDPVWGLSSQRLTFTNNIKMKLSVIMGIAHMTIGVIIKGGNTLFRGDYPSFLFEVVAGLVMLLGLFGWMDVLIFAKYFFPRNFTDYREVMSFQGKTEYVCDVTNRNTPSVINIMITTVFSGGSPTGVMYSLIPATPEGSGINLNEKDPNNEDL